jgi:hypothetical protein
MSAPVELIAMMCTRCQSPLAAQVDETAWVCPQCGQGMLLSDENGLAPLMVRYAAGLQPGTPGKPMWVAQGTVTLNRQTYGGNFLGGIFGSPEKEMQDFWSQPHSFFIPAYSLQLEQIIQAGVSFLRNPPAYQEVTGSHPFLPVTLKPGDVRPLAEFIIISIEAERKDKLKQITINLQLAAPELWVVP